jgi:hypothetical protein
LADGELSRNRKYGRGSLNATGPEHTPRNGENIYSTVGTTYNDFFALQYKILSLDNCVPEYHPPAAKLCLVRSSVVPRSSFLDNKSAQYRTVPCAGQIQTTPTVPRRATAHQQQIVPMQRRVCCYGRRVCPSRLSRRMVHLVRPPSKSLHATPGSQLTYRGMPQVPTDNTGPGHPIMYGL